MIASNFKSYEKIRHWLAPGRRAGHSKACQMPSVRPAVILHADIVGSTNLVRRNVALGHQRIQQIFRRLCNMAIAHAGAPRELRGDAAVIEFSNAPDAVRAALAFQQSNILLNATRIGSIEPSLRIGISMGDVVIADNTVTGEAVVLAQRLEQFASPGTVYVDGAVHDALRQELQFEYTYVGEQTVKGFPDPVRIIMVKEAPESSVMYRNFFPAPAVLMNRKTPDKKTLYCN